MSIIEKLHGVIPAVATPLKKTGDIDILAYRKLIRRIIDTGCNGIMILGTAGEGVALDYKNYTLAIETAVEEVNNMCPVIVGAGGSPVEAVYENIEASYRLGADAILNVPPFYYPLPQYAIEDFYMQLANKSKLPVMIYNIPALTKNRVSVETVTKLSKEKNIIGIKDSSGDFVFFQEILAKAQSDKFKVFQGRAPFILASMLLGADGSMCPIPNIAPELELEIHKYMKEGNIKQAQKNQNKIIEIVKLFGYVSNPISMNLKGLMSGLNICEKYTGESIPVLPEEKIKEFTDIYNNIINS